MSPAKQTQKIDEPLTCHTEGPFRQARPERGAASRGRFGTQTQGTCKMVPMPLSKAATRVQSSDVYVLDECSCHHVRPRDVVDACR